MKNKKASAQTYTYNTIKERILRGYYKRDFKIIESKISQELEISRTPVREAIKRLEQEGLIINKRVLNPNSSDIRHMFEMRILIESYSAQKAAKYMLDEKIFLLYDCLEKSKSSQKTDIIIQQNKRFHDLIVQESRNPIMISNVSHMQSIIYMFSQAVVFHKKPFLFKEHEAIYNAIAERIPNKASELMKEHLYSDLEFTLNLFD